LSTSILLILVLRKLILSDIIVTKFGSSLLAPMFFSHFDVFFYINI